MIHDPELPISEQQTFLGRVYLRVLEPRGSQLSRWVWAVGPLEGLAELWADGPDLAGSPLCLTVDAAPDTCLRAVESPVPFAG